MTRMYTGLLCAVAALLAAPHTVLAEPPMNDPMRPPADLIADAPDAKLSPVLQSIVIGPAQRYAIINGERVAPGSLYGDAKVIRIEQNAVTLRDAVGDTVLRLYPDINKVIDAPNRNRVAVGERGKQ